MEYQRIRGTRDILPEDSPVWQHVEGECRLRFRTYGYSEIRTPLMETSGLFTRGLGEGSEVVKKEMYVFQDKGGRDVALRPEGTAPVVRAVLENGLLKGSGALLKLYYTGTMYRYDRPQAGRYREFYQAGVEALGSLDPLLDVEVITLAVDLFSNLGLKDLQVAINSIGDAICRPNYLEALTKYFQSKKNELCADCRTRLERNALRILDCKEDGCRKVAGGAPKSVDFLCPECRQHFESVIKHLERAGFAFDLQPHLVRGLDYYTRTAFEIISGKLGAQNAVCGGGRYDNLVEQLGGSPTPAIGFAIGLDRLIGLLSHGSTGRSPTVHVYLVPLGTEAASIGFSLVTSLRGKGVSADMEYQNRSLKSALRTADRLGARFVVIIGEEELHKNEVLLRDMEKGEQHSIPISQLVERVLSQTLAAVGSH